MSRLHTLTGAGLFAAAAGLASLTGAGAVHASAPPDTTAAAATTPAPAAKQALLDRLEVACDRTPRIRGRVEAAITLLGGDASTHGSIAWLEARLADARAGGRTQLATVLDNRVTVRTSRLELLQDRSTALGDIESLCSAHGLGA